MPESISSWLSVDLILMVAITVHVVGRQCTMASTRPGSKRGRRKLPTLNLRILLKLGVELKFCQRRQKYAASYSVAYDASVVNTSTLASGVASSAFFTIFGDAMDAKALSDHALRSTGLYFEAILFFPF